MQDLHAFDWDDTALIKAYNKGMKLKDSKAKEKTTGKSKEKLTWKEGDFCRAPFSSDGLHYECTITTMGLGVCTVKFLGYEDEEEVPLESLKPSAGKKSRKLQTKQARKAQSGYATESDSSAYSAERPKSAGADANFPNAAPLAARPPMFDSQPMFPPNAYGNMPMMPPLTHPPMPPCRCSNQSSLSAMLTSWYMAGYYTGMHSVQKKSHMQNCCYPGNQYPPYY